MNCAAGERGDKNEGDDRGLGEQRDMRRAVFRMQRCERLGQIAIDANDQRQTRGSGDPCAESAE